MLRLSLAILFVWNFAAIGMSEDWLPRDQESLDQWDRVRPANGCIRFKDGFLQIRALPGRIARTKGDEFSAKNILLRDLPEGDFTVTLSVGHAPRRPGDQVGLFLYRDDGSNFGAVSGFLESMNARGVFCVLKQDRWLQQSAQYKTAQYDIDLRFEVRGSVGLASYREARASKFTHLGRLRLPDGKLPLRMALVACRAPGDHEYWATLYSLDVQLQPKDN